MSGKRTRWNSTFPAPDKPIARKKGVRKRRADRAAAKYERNFHSAEYVLFTKAQPCAFCNGGPCFTAHMNARGMGGSGGDWTRTLPVCWDCDSKWDSPGWGPERFLASIGWTWEDVERAIAAHQAEWAKRQQEAEW